MKWLIRLEKHKMNYKNGDKYLYWISNLKKPWTVLL